MEKCDRKYQMWCHWLQWISMQTVSVIITDFCLRVYTIRQKNPIKNRLRLFNSPGPSILRGGGCFPASFPAYYSYEHTSKDFHRSLWGNRIYISLIEIEPQNKICYKSVQQIGIWGEATMVLYHGSNTGNIKVLKPNQADHDRPYVYMTTMDVVAAFYLCNAVERPYYWFPIMQRSKPIWIVVTWFFQVMKPIQ